MREHVRDLTTKHGDENSTPDLQSSGLTVLLRFVYIIVMRHIYITTKGVEARIGIVSMLQERVNV